MQVFRFILTDCNNIRLTIQAKASEWFCAGRDVYIEMAARSAASVLR